MNIVFANNVDQYEAAHNEPPFLDLLCLSIRIMRYAGPSLLHQLLDRANLRLLQMLDKVSIFEEILLIKLFSISEHAFFSFILC